MSALDKMRIAAVEILKDVGYVWDDAAGEWTMRPVDQPRPENRISLIDAGDLLAGLALDQACTLGIENGEPGAQLFGAYELWNSQTDYEVRHLAAGRTQKPAR